jgi:hypothetical protein
MSEGRHPFQNGWWRRYLPFAAGFLAAATLLLALSLKIQSYWFSPATYRTAQGAAAGDLKVTGGGVRAAGSEQDRSNSAPAQAPAPDERPARPPIDEKELARLTPVEKFVYSESLKIGRADPSPERTHRKLKAVARGLGRLDMENLKIAALNTAFDNDRRFMSVFLLALSEKDAAAPALLSIALTPLSIQDTGSRLYAEELMIRTQALEGLGAARPGTLKDFLRKQDNAFLADQARRLLREKKSRR